MRFSAAHSASKLPLPLAGGVADVIDDEPPRPAGGSTPPWPADQPPDDLDERVRLVGEWQLDDW